MQNNLFLRRLIVKTEQGKTAYDESFHRGVNIIRGQNSSGKSTIIRFIFFVLGGCYGDFVPEALHCKLVVAEVEINGKVITLKRYLEKTEDGNKVIKYTPIYIYFGSIAEYLADKRLKNEKWQKYGYKTTDHQRSFSNVLFELMGLPEFKADSNITMHQILRLIYLDQESPLSSLFFFDMFDKELTRVTVAELLMGLYDEKLSEAKLQRESLNKRQDEVKQLLKLTLEFLSDPTTKSPAFILARIDNLTKEIEDITMQVQAIRSGNTNKVNQNFQFKQEYIRMQAQVGQTRSQVVELEDEISELKHDTEDSAFFIETLRRKMEAVERSIATRDYFDTLHLEYCPECLTKIEELVPEGHCRLCKSPIDNSKGKSQALRIKLELGFQIRESEALLKQNTTLLVEKEAKHRSLKRKLTTLQKEYDLAVRNVRSSQEECIDALLQEKGYKEGEIAQFRTLLEYAEKYEQLCHERDDLKVKVETLNRYINAAEMHIKNEREKIERCISCNGVYLLKNDQDRQDEFRNATDFKLDYEQNMAYLTDRQIKLSASSSFYLKMTARFAFFLASLQVDSMMYPRLMFSDNMEDKGMEPERAANFQRLVVSRLKEMPNQDYQLIFATSMIAPELEKPEFTIGENYTRENKSLKHV
jgi:hypothetical protein